MTEREAAPWLSVVIPAYNEASRIGPTLERICEYLRDRPGSFEILAVDDGSTDGTVAVIDRCRLPEVRVVRHQRNVGKGGAVRSGVLASTGSWVLISDADLSTPIEEFERLEAQAEAADLVLGSRAAVDSRIGRHQPLFRELMGKCFNLVIRSLGLVDLKDTQCGFKLIRGPVARELFGLVTVERFAFDVELVWLARRSGYRVVEVGVAWDDSPQSRVNPLWDSLNMLWDVLKLRARRRF